MNYLMMLILVPTCLYVIGKIFPFLENTAIYIATWKYAVFSAKFGGMAI